MLSAPLLSPQLLPCRAGPMTPCAAAARLNLGRAVDRPCVRAHAQGASVIRAGAFAARNASPTRPYETPLLQQQRGKQQQQERQPSHWRLGQMRAGCGPRMVRASQSESHHPPSPLSSPPKGLPYTAPMPRRAVAASAAAPALSDPPSVRSDPAASGVPEPEPQGVDALIVGGGPAGLATALLLHKRGWKRIVVLEQQASVTKADLTKSYVYAIDGRGRKALDLFGLTEQVMEAGAMFGDLMSVPAKGKAKSSTLFIRDVTRRSYWMPRATFQGLLMGAVEKAGPAIQVVTSAACLSVERAGDGPLRVLAHSTQGPPLAFEPSLLIGADGVQSVVRQQLEAWYPGEGRFAMQKFPSPAAGLRIKVMMVPPNPPTRPESGEGGVPVAMANPKAVVAIGNNGLRLGMLPIKDEGSPRTANVILKPDHPFWNITTPDRLLSHLEDSFPQLPIRQIISQEQAEAFLASSGTIFPRPQYCPSMQLLVHSKGEVAGSTPAGSGGGNGNPGLAGKRVQGVLLVGDAVHCFPPDLGQGVNSALEDIWVLDQVLSECGDRVEDALPLYEQRRLPDVKALIRLMQFGYPYQYNQDAVGKTLWTVNFLLRLQLNKMLPWLIAPPAFMMVQDPSLPYSEIVKKADASTTALWIVAGLLIAAAVVFLGAKPAA